MRNIYDSGGERVTLGIKRAIMAAIIYTGSMTGCALAIVLAADGVARQAANLMMPLVTTPPGSVVPAGLAGASKSKPAASNAAIIASVEARKASRQEAAASGQP